MISEQAKKVKYFIRKNNSGVNKSIQEAREDARNTRSIIRFPEGIKKEIIEADNVKCELFSGMESKEDKIIIYFHGGGYCLGVEENTRNFVAKVAYGSGIKTLLIDYRLAPENKYPAAHSDAFTTYRWTIGKGYKPENIIFMGDSSGCGLMLATLLKLKNMKLDMPAGAVLISPLVDYSKTGASLIDKKESDPYQYNDPYNIADNFLDGNDVDNKFISPIRGNLSGLPKMLIHGSGDDVFLSDSINLAEKAQEYGVNVSMKIWDELWHVFHVTADIVPEAQEALNEIYEFINSEIIIRG